MDQIIQTELDTLKNIIINTLPVEQIILFGSYAYGTTHKDSDLDLYVVVKDDMEMREIDAGVKIRTAICRAQTMPLDIIVSKNSTFLRRKLGPTMERKIAREGIKIYG
jgi:predicted nucleotidyltransferase